LRAAGRKLGCGFGLVAIGGAGSQQSWAKPFSCRFEFVQAAISGSDGNVISSFRSRAQFSTLLDLQPKSDRIQDALAYVKKNLEKDLSVEVLAEAAQLSPRQFSRAFRAETGQSPPRRWRTCVSRRCV
jgi:hypothetical protein